MYTVQVLLSTYNGETYLKEQLDSILNQKNVAVKLSSATTVLPMAPWISCAPMPHSTITFVTYVAKTAAWSLLSFVCSNYLTRMWISMPSPIRTMCGTKTSFPSPARSLNRCANQNPKRKRRMIPRSVHLPHHFSTVVMHGILTTH